MKKIIYFLLIISGISLIAYPQLNEMYQNHREKVLLQNFEQSFSDSPNSNQISSTQFEKITSNVAVNEEPSPIINPLDTNSKSLLKNGAIAIISIKKIDLVLPVLEGATVENMKYAATHISETTPLGGVGNAGIAGHRMRAKGSLFNRLDEVSIGDKIVVRKLDKEFIYTVFSVSIVEPTDVSVLNRNNKDSILTLITCDPIINATHRLIIHAKL